MPRTTTQAGIAFAPPDRPASDGGRRPEAVIERHGNIAPLAAEWDELADRTRALPWARPGWIESWWRAFGQGELDVVALRHGGQLRAVLPLRRHHGSLASTTNWHTPEFAATGDQASVAALVDALLATRPRRVSLQFVDAAGGTASELRRSAAARRYHLIVRTLERSPYVRIDGDWAAYEASRDGKLLRDLRRRRRRLGTDGELSLHVTTGEEGLDALLDEGFRVEASGWKGERGTAIASSPATRRFYSDVARWAASRGSLRLAFLRHGAQPVAFDFAYEEGGIHYLLKTGYDPGARRFAPGKLLRYAMIERAFRLGLESYEFLGDDNPWKQEWTHTVREWSLVQAFSPSLAGHADWAAFAYGRPLVKRVLARMGR